MIGGTRVLVSVAGFCKSERIGEDNSDLRSNDDLSEDVRLAICGLADLLERAPADNGMDYMPHVEWEALFGRAREFAKNIPVDCLD